MLKFMDSGEYMRAPCWKCDPDLVLVLLRTALKVKEVKALLKHVDQTWQITLLIFFLFSDKSVLLTCKKGMKRGSKD